MSKSEMPVPVTIHPVIMPQIKEQWEADIVVSAHLRAMTLFSEVANALYDDQLASQREARLREIPEMSRLESLLHEESDLCAEALAAWNVKLKERRTNEERV